MPDLSQTPCIYPTFRYRDPDAMIRWLEALGFRTRAAYRGPDGGVMHAELAHGASMIMLGAIADDAYGKVVGTEVVPGGKSTYVAVDNADALFARAEAAGAEVVEGLVDRSYGSREFILRDPEGNIWSFGTYWPKASDPA